MTLETPAFRAMTRARSRLILSNAFFGTLASRLELIETTALPTQGTDGIRHYYNPEFTLGLSDQELIGVVVHEVCHCADRHQTRRGDRDPLVWNIAADFRVNFDVKSCGFILPWKGCTLAQFLEDLRRPVPEREREHRHFYDPQFRDLGVEEIYRIVHEAIERELDHDGDHETGAGNGPSDARGAPPDDSNGEGGAGVARDQENAPTGNGAPANGNSTEEGNGQINAPDPGGCGSVIDAAPAHDPVGRAEATREWETILRQAAAVAKTQAAGTLPGYIRRLIDELNNPSVDWRVELRRFADLTNHHKDYTWSRPSRRHLWRGVILPGLRSDRPTHVVIVQDTSGSVYDGRPQEQFRSEMQAILDDGACDRITVVMADTRVAADPETFEAGDLIRLDVAGGGGTSFREPLAWVAENCEDAAAIVFLTDMETSDWGEEPACPILWAVVGPQERARQAAAAAPFGEVLFIGD